MDVDKRDWGRINPVDYLPFVGMAYRIYWWIIARKGEYENGGEDWERATYKELSRMFVALVFTIGFGIFVVLGADTQAFKPALVVVIGGVFVHKVATSVMSLF